jgi:hypothetical protein
MQLTKPEKGRYGKRKEKSEKGKRDKKKVDDGKTKKIKETKIQQEEK